MLSERRSRRGLTDAENGWCRNVVRFPQQPGPCHLSVCGVTRGGKRRAYLTYERRTPGAKALYVDREPIHAVAEAALRALFAAPGLRAALERLEPPAPPAAGPEGAELIRQRLVLLRRRYQEAVDAEFDAERAELQRALSERRLRLERELAGLQAGLESLADERRPDRQFRAILTEVPELSRHFAAAWGLLNGEERRQLTETVLREIQVTVTPRPRTFDRDVTALLYHEWVADFLHR